MNVPLQAITTRYLPPSNRRGARVKAIASCGSLILAWDHSEASDYRQHWRAAETLIERQEWQGKWVGGGLPDSMRDSYVFVRCPGD